MRHRRTLSPSEFRQQVCAFRRDELLRRVAQVSARTALEAEKQPAHADEPQLLPIRQGALQAVAGISVMSGNNRRDTAVDFNDVRDLVYGFLEVREPELDDSDSVEAWQVVWSHRAYSQFPFQWSPWEPTMRSLCLFGDDSRFGDPVFSADEMDRMLGVSLVDLLRVCIVMYVAAQKNDGSVSRDTLTAAHVAPLFLPLDASHALEVVDRLLAGDPDQLAQRARSKQISKNDLWGVNPLFERPLLTMGDTYVMPCAPSILQKVSPQGLFFTASEFLDTDEKAFREFTKRLGGRFERYIEQQLRLLTYATVTPEIVYDGDQRSVDFIVEMQDFVLLVEVKSAAPTVQMRTGNLGNARDVSEVLQKACDQIDRTAELLQQQHPAFPDPRGRPMRGLVITREPYYMLGTPFFDSLIRSPRVPTTILPSQYLETALPTLIDDPDRGARLLEALPSDPATIHSNLGSLDLRMNPLLGELWDKHIGSNSFGTDATANWEGEIQ